MNVRKKKSKRNDKEDDKKILKFTIDKDTHECTTDQTSASDDQITCQFFLNNVNVTPCEIVSEKYPKVSSDENWPISPLPSTSYSFDSNDENDDDYFLKLDSKVCDDLLNELRSFQRGNFDGRSTDGAKYDVGPSVEPPKENIAAKGYEIVLTESDTFTLFDMPSRVTVEGDGDYEQRLAKNEIYKSNCARRRVKKDAATQTVNSFMDREDVKCQTRALTLSTADTQVHSYEIVDAYAGEGLDESRPSSFLSTKESSTSTVDDDDDDDDMNARIKKTAMYVLRVLAQNTLMMDGTEQRTVVPSRDPLATGSVELTYNFTFPLPDGAAGMTITGMHWNQKDTDLLAVAYSKSVYDDGGGDGPNAVVAVWNTINPINPERYYEFDESAITCVRFSIKCPNRLAVGFYCGDILIVDISRERRKILYQKSREWPLDMKSIVGLFWTVRIENELSRANQSECLVTCNSSGGVDRYRFCDETNDVKIICKKLLKNDDEELTSTANIGLMSICDVTAFIWFDEKMFMVGTSDGLLFTRKSSFLPTNTAAHFGPVKSLERSPYSSHLYLTTGCDCSVKIWVGDIFVEPAIILKAGQQIQKAAWSRTNPTVIVSVVDNSLYTWNMDVTVNSPVLVHELPQFSESKCAHIEFTLDGKHVCVTDTDGRIVMYGWSDISTAAAVAGEAREDRSLMRCIAKSLHGKKKLRRTLCKELPEYVDVFATLYDEG